MAQRSHGVPRKGTRKWRRADHEQVCTRCRPGVIAAGSPFVLDMTGAPQHPDCARRGIVPYEAREAPRRWDSPIPRPEPTDEPCPECGHGVTREQRATSVTAFGLRFHGDCRHRMRGGATD